MSLFLYLVLFINFFIKNCCAQYADLGTEESLRQDIQQLLKGKLKFTNESPKYKEELDDITPRNNSVYDFIIVGAGTAGAVVASRLSEVKNVTVLLVEAGSNEYPIMDIPRIAAADLLLNPDWSWQYNGVPSYKYCLGYSNFSCFLRRGKVVGGCGVTNNLLATRGNKKDYDDWSEITGDYSWSYKNMLYYLKKLEDFQVDDVEVDNYYHNKYGPMTISGPVYKTQISDLFIKAGQELGYTVNDDYNRASQAGFSFGQFLINNGERWSVNRGYLHPIKDRSNIFLSTRSHVTKVLIDEKTKSAYGISFTKDNKNFVVKARKEVILSAGVFNSPQILMLSGIGPRKHLEDLGIKVIKDAPGVGENLAEHISNGGFFINLNDSSLIPENLDLFDPKNPAIKEYIKDRNGTLALSFFKAMAFMNVYDASDDDPNVQILLDDVSKNNSLTPRVRMTMVLLKPKSRGKILLRSVNPYDHPLIYPNYFDEPEDLRILIKANRWMTEFIKNNKEFQKYGAQLDRDNLFGVESLDNDNPVDDNIQLCKNHYELDSDEYWECTLRTYTDGHNHLTGTCQMGKEGDVTSVVNSNLQILGIKNLRVVDASIFPTIPIGYPIIPTISIAEKISDVIKKFWGYN